MAESATRITATVDESFGRNVAGSDTAVACTTHYDAHLESSLCAPIAGRYDTSSGRTLGPSLLCKADRERGPAVCPGQV